MAIEQSIYTCVLKRRDNGKTGFGYYSFTSGFEKVCSENPQIKKASVSYASPRNQEIWWSYADDEEIRDMEEAENIFNHHPISFSYIPVKDKSVFTFGKNLGRDIMKSRPGNILINTLIMDEIEGYPFSYYGSPELFIDYDVNYFYRNGAEIPPLLENPERINKCTGFTFKDVCRFINENDRIEQLYSMFQILLDYNDPRKSTRQIMICDKKDNIIYWIAALSLLLPVELAKKFSFTTYSFLASRPDDITPIYEDTMLCGVYSAKINGDEADERATNYNYTTEVSRTTAALFDFDKGSFPDTEIESGEFELLIESAMNGDITQLRDYHEFLMTNTSYRNLDNDYLSGYSFYLIYNYPDVDNMNCLENAREFIIKYADNSCLNEILENLMAATVDKGNVGSECRKLLDFVGIAYRDRSAADKESVCLRYINYLRSLLYSENVNKADYAEKRDIIKNFCRNIGVSYHGQLATVLNNDEILELAKKTTKKWILTELADIIIHRMNKNGISKDSDIIFKKIITRILSDKKNRIQFFSHYMDLLVDLNYQVNMMNYLFAVADDEFRHEIIQYSMEKLTSAEDKMFLAEISKTSLYSAVFAETFALIQSDETFTFRKIVDLMAKILYNDTEYKSKALECMLDKMVFADTPEEEMANIYETFRFAKMNGILDAKTADNLAVAYKADVFALQNWYDIEDSEFDRLEEILQSVGSSTKNPNETENVCNLYVMHLINKAADSSFMDSNDVTINFGTLNVFEKTTFIGRITDYFYRCSLMNNTAFLNFQNVISLPIERKASNPSDKIMYEWLIRLVQENPKKQNLIAELILVMTLYCKIDYGVIAQNLIQNNIKPHSIISYYESNNDAICREISRRYGFRNSGNFVRQTGENLLSAYNVEKPSSTMNKIKSTFGKWRKN